MYESQSGCFATNAWNIRSTKLGQKYLTWETNNHVIELYFKHVCEYFETFLKECIFQVFTSVPRIHNAVKEKNKDVFHVSLMKGA
ncbi:hypothetical protein TNCT_345681 [Trichonephila clavata]|uniref:Uncharacterized protein n=1 Tax=Trichonephila clavata TaxID=2740835 RepID=A0A8X6GXA6_TRICU|nr:hypothetical protein TNCT_345681 [Trichonephila clavata]